jgi:hypothetical protein
MRHPFRSFGPQGKHAMSNHPEFRPASHVLRNKYGREMRSSEILAEFGLPPSGPIPKDYAAEKIIDGVVVHIVPRGSHKKKRRVLAECPICATLVCAGHLHQHFKIHKESK